MGRAEDIFALCWQVWDEAAKLQIIVPIRQGSDQLKDKKVSGIRLVASRRNGAMIAELHSPHLRALEARVNTLLATKSSVYESRKIGTSTMLNSENQTDKKRFEKLKEAQVERGRDEQKAIDVAASEVKEMRKREGRSKDDDLAR
jgi:hypothetical protein